MVTTPQNLSYTQQRKRNLNTTLKIVTKSQENKRGKEKETYKNKFKTMNEMAKEHTY